MKIAIGSDHGGVEYKEIIKKHLIDKGFEVSDFGTYGKQSVDYPDIAKAVGESVVKKENEFGVLICGTGIGISISANKVKGIRAALCNNEFSARMAREHNDANILCLGQRVMGDELCISITDAFFSSDFTGERHQLRVDKISAME